eukprot:jgi/Bigna1/60582/fgenesh1_kg.13_\
MSNEWNNGFFGCFSVKGCAMMPCCIPNCICCMPCMWGSATSQIKGKEDWGSFWKCCLAVQFCPCCTFCVAYRELTAHYGIEDSMWPLKACVFPVLSYYQIVDTIMVREKLHMINIWVVPDGVVSVGQQGGM